MDYQVIKHLKTKSKCLGIFPSLEEAHKKVKSIMTGGVKYEGRSYVGGFPTFQDEFHYTYSIQGAVDMGGQLVVCSINDKELIAQGL